MLAKSSVTFGSLVLLLIVNSTRSASCGIQTIFLHQPSPMDGVFPIGEQVVFGCSVAQGYLIERWSVELFGRQFSTHVPKNVDFLLILGITKVDISTTESMLIVNSTETTNGIEIFCEAIASDNYSSVHSSCAVNTLFYGPPSAPTELMATENGAGSLSLSWVLSGIERIPTNFTLRATNLNSTDSSNRVTEISGIGAQEFNFTMEVDSCIVYTFQVTASNGAGVSGPSEIISKSIPTIPDLTIIQKSLAKTTDGVLLTVTIHTTSECPEYPVTGYALVLKDSAGENTTEALTQPMGNDLLILKITLLEDEEYSISIVATNAIGTSTTSPIQIITSDVQGVSLCLVEGSTYSIQCSYIPGSYNASGCTYVLVSVEENVTNLTGTVAHTDAVQVQISELYSMLSVFDVLEEGINSSEALLIATVALNTAKKCQIEVKIPSSIILPILITVPVVIVVVFLAVLIISLLHHKQGFTYQLTKKLEKHQRNIDSIGGLTARRSTEMNSYSQSHAPQQTFIEKSSGCEEARIGT